MNFAQLNFDVMTGPQLVEQFNHMAKDLGVDPVKKFSDRKSGVKRCEKLRAELDAKAAKAPVVSPVAISKGKAARAPQVAARRANVAAGKVRLSARDERKIYLLVEENPRRTESHAAVHFELMRGKPTVAEYLEKFEEGKLRSIARHWLYNTVADGFVEVK